MDFYIDSTARHALQLGLYCGGQFSGDYFYVDVASECEDPTSDVIFLDEDASNILLGDETRFSCIGEGGLLDYDSYNYQEGGE